MENNSVGALGKTTVGSLGYHKNNAIECLWSKGSSCSEDPEGVTSMQCEEDEAELDMRALK